MTLETLRKHYLYAKLSKYTFGSRDVSYLGHSISKRGVRANLTKIKVMLNWPRPKFIKCLRGFLGLTGYYSHFVKGYEEIASTVTELLKKDAFMWCEAAGMAFQKLKDDVTQPPVLALPNFLEPFRLSVMLQGL